MASGRWQGGDPGTGGLQSGLFEITLGKWSLAGLAGDIFSFSGSKFQPSANLVTAVNKGPHLVVLHRA
jgi:hypothetical protein